MAENEKAEMRIQRCLRPLCHTHHPRLQAQKRSGRLLESVLTHHRHVRVEPQAPPRLGDCTEKQRLRKPAHHRARTRRQMGGSADTYRTHGRSGRTRTGGTLALQRHQEQRRRSRHLARRHTLRTRIGRGPTTLQGSPARNRHLCLHTQRRPLQTPGRSHPARLCLQHPHRSGKQMRRRNRQREKRAHTPGA